MLVGPAGEVDLEGESLLEAVAALDVDRVDPVQRLLGQPDDVRVLRGDLAGDLVGRSAQLLARHDLQHRAEVVQLLRRRGLRGVDHRPHQVRRHEPGEMGRGAKRSAVDLGKAESGVVTGDDDVSVADQADAAAEAEAVHRGDDRHLALVDGGERGVTTAVGTDQRAEAGGALHLLDVDAGVEAAAFGGQHDDVDTLVAAGADQGIGELEPAGDRQGIHRRVVDDDLGNRTVPVDLDTHWQDRPSRPSACLVTYQPVTAAGSVDYAGRAYS